MQALMTEAPAARVESNLVVSTALQIRFRQVRNEGLALSSSGRLSWEWCQWALKKASASLTPHEMGVQLSDCLDIALRSQIRLSEEFNI